MEQKEIIEGNKLIAEFMKLTPNPNDGGKTYAIGETIVTDDNEVFAEKWEILKYHCSWDWIMPVVEKIEEEEACIIEMWLSLGKGCRISKMETKQPTIHFSAEDNVLISAVYTAVLQFIRWYNQQPL